MQVIIPCSGRSSRYPTTRPKFLLTMPDGRPMFMHAADYYYTHHPITFVVVEEHCKLYGADDAIKNAYGDTVNIVVLPDFTNGPADTVYQTVKDWNDTAFLSKDCDGFFDHMSAVDGNVVATIDLQQYPQLRNIAAKSFVISEDGLIRNIVEKHVVSSHICVGAYGFSSSKRYSECYQHIAALTKQEIFISHVIKYDMDHNSSVYKSVAAKNYVDCGTYEDFIHNSKNHATIFSDIDGVVFKNQSLYFKNNYTIEPVPNPTAVQFLLKKQADGATIVFTTSRPARYSTITENALDKLGFTQYRILYDLPHAPRLLINDVSTTNPWPSASAINVPRDDDNFWKSML